MPLPKNTDVIVHIGAGRCEELTTYLASSAKRIMLIEANAQLAAELRARCGNEPRISVLEVAVSNNPADNELKEYNLADANSLYSPMGLKQLFPGLRLLGHQPVTTITGDELLKQCALNSDQNVLVIQAPGAELGIIESLTESGGIDQFCYLSLTCAETPLYATPSDSAAVLKVLQEQGFDLVHRDKTDPDWPIWTLHHNALKQKFADLTIKYQKISEQLKLVQKELAAERAKSENPASAPSKLEQENKSYKDSLDRAKKDLSEEQDKTKKLSAELAKLKQEIATYKDELSKASGQARPNQTAKDFENLEKRLEYFFNQHTLQLEQAANALGRHVTSTVTGTAKELEAGIALQQQFGRDLPSLEDRGVRLPAAVALQLSRQLRSTPYDVIIEFGSGVTTNFMAHTLRNQPSNEKRGEGTEVAQYVDPSDDDLPKRIVCFEHNRAKYNELATSLKESGLAPIIQLQCAPLVAYQHQGEEHLYYDCATRLQQLARLFEEREARIFVWFNITKGESQPSQIVALPQLLQSLSAHSLDIVVPGAAGSELLEHWYSVLKTRGLDFRKANNFGNSDARMLRINP